MAPVPTTSSIAPSATLATTTPTLLYACSEMATALTSPDTQLNITAMVSPQAPYAAISGPMDNSALFRSCYTAASLFCMMVLALMLGSRAKHLGFNDLMAMNLMRFLVIALYVTAMIFVASTAILQNGIGINQPIVCHAGSYICLAFYILNKALMYMFMIERAHSIRAPFTRRLKDWVWCFWMLFSGIGFAVLVAVAFVYPHTQVDNGSCELGLPQGISLALLMYDVLINFSLTTVFIWLIRPLLAFHRSNDPDSKSYFRDHLKKTFNKWFSWIPIRLSDTGGPYHQAVSQSIAGKVEWLVWKTIAGSVLIVMPTIANLVSLTAIGGREHAWVCFTVCTADIAWSVYVIHWMTVDPLEVASRPTARPNMRNGRTSPRSDVETPVQPLRPTSTSELTQTKQ